MMMTQQIKTDPQREEGGGKLGGVARRFGLIDDLDCFLIDFR